MPPPDTPSIVRGKTFVGDRIRLDGRTFVGCRFRDCTLEIAGSAAFALERCDVSRCEWIVVGCAATAIRMLARVQQDYDARPLIEDLQGQVRV